MGGLATALDALAASKTYVPVLSRGVASGGRAWRRERAGRNSAAHSATHIVGIDFTVAAYGLCFAPRARHGPEPPYGLPSWLAAAAFRLVNSGDIYQARLCPWADRSLMYLSYGDGR